METLDDHTLYALAGQAVVAKRVMAAQLGRRVALSREKIFLLQGAAYDVRHI